MSSDMLKQFLYGPKEKASNLKSKIFFSNVVKT